MFVSFVLVLEQQVERRYCHKNAQNAAAICVLLLPCIENGFCNSAGSLLCTVIAHNINMPINWFNKNSKFFLNRIKRKIMKMKTKDQSNVLERKQRNSSPWFPFRAKSTSIGICYFDGIQRISGRLELILQGSPNDHQRLHLIIYSKWWQSALMTFLCCAKNIRIQGKVAFTQRKAVQVLQIQNCFCPNQVLLCWQGYKHKLWDMTIVVLQTRMRSHPVGLDVCFLAWPFVYIHSSCVRTAKLWWD